MYVVVNPTANGGVAHKRWRRLRTELESRYGLLQVAETRSLDDAEDALQAFGRSGDSLLVAAGGDGTVNGVVDLLFKSGIDRERVHLGAIGIGSSNDFHKPFPDRELVARIPVRVDQSNTARVDVGRALLTPPSGERTTRHFVLNGCVGLVAAGNDFFNHGDRVLRALKTRSVSAAIFYSTMVTIWRNQPVDIELSLDGSPFAHRSVANLHFLKKVQFAGGMLYDTSVTADDGYFDICTWEPMSRWDVLKTAMALQRGKFKGRKHTQVERARKLAIRSRDPIALELDGEVERIVEAEIEVLPRALSICK